MKSLLSIPILTAYLYVLTVVNFYGFNSYFNIPYNYIEFSIKDHIVFFFDLSRLIAGIFSQITGWAWFGIIVTLLVLLAFFFFSRIGRWLIVAGFIALVIYLPFGFYRFGNFLASASTSFYTAPSTCIPGATEDLYIAPTLFEGKVVFVPIATSTHQLQNGLLVRETSALTCQLEKKEIGRISK